MREIGELIRKVLKEEKVEGLDDLVRIRGEWEDIVGGKKGKKTRPYRLDGKRLYIDAESHAWAQELRYSVEEIKSAIKRRLGIEVEEVIARKSPK